MGVVIGFPGTGTGERKDRRLNAQDRSIRLNESSSPARSPVHGYILLSRRLLMTLSCGERYLDTPLSLIPVNGSSSGNRLSGNWPSGNWHSQQFSRAAVYSTPGPRSATGDGLTGLCRVFSDARVASRLARRDQAVAEVSFPSCLAVETKDDLILVSSSALLGRHVERAHLTPEDCKSPDGPGYLRSGDLRSGDLRSGELLYRSARTYIAVLADSFLQGTVRIGQDLIDVHCQEGEWLVIPQVSNCDANNQDGDHHQASAPPLFCAGVSDEDFRASFMPHPEIDGIYVERGAIWRLEGIGEDDLTVAIIREDEDRPTSISLEAFLSDFSPVRNGDISLLSCLEFLASGGILSEEAVSPETVDVAGAIHRDLQAFSHLLAGFMAGIDEDRTSFS